MKTPDLFERDPSAFFELLEQEEERSLRLQRGFCVLRVEARSGMQGPRELLRLYRTVASVLRRTDRVQPVGGQGLAAVLSDADPIQAEVAGQRVRDALSLHGARFRPALGWACTLPGQIDWRDAWRTAGVLMLADVAAPAAA
jgi:hypothetical protein